MPVQHGRRKGTSRAEEGLAEMCGVRVQGLVEDVLRDEKVPSMRRTTTIDRKELRRIHAEVCDEDPEAEEARRWAAEWKAMHERSKEMSKNWPGCSVGSRDQKLADHKAKEDALETERVEIDRKEAEYQAQLRHERMEEARKMLNWQSDRFKNFNSALNLDETMRERNLQIEMKKKIAQDIKNREKDDRARQKAALKSLMEEEAEREAKKQKIRMDVAAFQQFQMQTQEDNLKKAEAENMVEGEKIQAAYREYLEDNRLTAEKQREQQNNFKRHLYTQREQQEENARLERHMINEEDAERKITSLARRQLAYKKLAKDKEMKREKDLIKDALYQRLQKYFKEKGDNYDEMIRRAREAEDAKIAEEEAEKMAKRKKDTDEQIRHLQQTMREHEEERRRAKEEDIKHGKEMAEAAAIFAKEEAAKIDLRREEEKQADLINRRLRVRAAEKVQEKRNQSLAIDLFNEMNDRKRESEFHEYATRTISEARNRGAPTYAMEKERARVLARDKTCDDQFLGKGPLKPDYMTEEEMRSYIQRLNIKEDQLCVEKHRGRTDKRFEHC